MTNDFSDEANLKGGDLSPLNVPRGQGQGLHNTINITKSSQQYQIPISTSSGWTHFQNNNDLIECKAENPISSFSYTGEGDKNKPNSVLETNHSANIQSPISSPSSSSTTHEKRNVVRCLPNNSSIASDLSFTQNILKKEEDSQFSSQVIDRNMLPPLANVNGNSVLFRRISQCSTASNSSGMHSPRCESGEFSDVSDGNKSEKNTNGDRNDGIRNMILPIHLALKSEATPSESQSASEKKEDELPTFDAFDHKDTRHRRTPSVPGKVDGKKSLTNKSIHI